MVPITHMAPIIYFPDTLRLLKLKLIQLKVTHDDSTSAGTKYKRYGIIFCSLSVVWIRGQWD